MYELKDLIEKFKQHAEQADKNQEEWKKSWEDNNPNEPIPDHYTDDFNLPKALASICQEIEELKKGS